MDFPTLPARIRVISNDTDEPELVGLEGDLSKRDPNGNWVVFLDNDKMPTRFPSEELVVLDRDGNPLREWEPWLKVEPGTRERLSALAADQAG